MNDLIDFFEAHLEAENKRPATIRQYGEFLRRFERFLSERYDLALSRESVARIRGAHLSEYLQELNRRDRAASTRNNYIIILKRFFGFLVDIGAIDGDPSHVLRLVREKRTPESLEKESQKRYTLEEISALLRALTGPRPRQSDLRNAAILALILGSGLRTSEVCALNVSQRRSDPETSSACAKAAIGDM